MTNAMPIANMGADTTLHTTPPHRRKPGPGLRTRLLARVRERRARLVQVALLLAHGQRDVDGAPVTIETLHSAAIGYEAAVSVAGNYTGKERLTWPYTP